MQEPTPACLTRAPGHLRLEAKSDTSALAGVRHAVENFVAMAGFDLVACGEIGLAVNEAMSNVIRHAYDGIPGQPIQIVVESPVQLNDAAGKIHAGPMVRIRMRDWGNGRNPASMLDRQPNPLVPGGVGMTCLRKLMDSVLYMPQPDGMLLEMTRRRKD